MAGIRFRRFLQAGRLPISEDMSSKVMSNMRECTRRAEGLAAGSGGMSIIPINPCALDPAHELPGRQCPMFVQPPPRRSLLQRIAGAIFSLGLTIAAGGSLMVLAQYLTTPT
jgi:hypothetical protein